jgi:LL-diaminopimelate aminotransferase
MATVNTNYLNLEGAYLFSGISKKVAAYKQANPDKKVISLGIGDVTRPLTAEVINALHHAVNEMADAKTFRGYGPDGGYDFLREKIKQYDYERRGISIDLDEIFVSDGAKSDMGNIGDIFSNDLTVGISDPVYPVYKDTNIMAGRNIKMLKTSEQTGFLPVCPDFKLDIVYLCSPNNPTGAAFTRAELKAWVDYAAKNGTIIFYDAAYEAFIRDDNIPHSIYEIEGAKNVAIEFKSYSKTAGFTGTRCGYTVVPKQLMGKDMDGNDVSINKLWARRQSTKFNGTPYIVQRAAAAIYSEKGQAEIKENIDYYLSNAKIILDTVKELGFTAFGGQNAPYIWLGCKDKMPSWEFFDLLLEKLSIVGTPGVGFGDCGEGYFRLTAFGSREDTLEAMSRFKAYFK